MTDVNPTPTPAPLPSNSTAAVSITAGDVASIADTIAGLVAAINPALAAGAALADGAVTLITKTLVPMVEHLLGTVELSVVQQAALKAKADASRLASGAAPDDVT